jgi:LysR family transcriptional regulator, cyn operon transcriptional activator
VAIAGSKRGAKVRFGQRVIAPPIYLLAVLSRAHRLAHRALVEIAELAERSLLLLRREFGSCLWFDAACQVANIRPRVLLKSAAPHTPIALAGAASGIAVLASTEEIPSSDLGVAITWDETRRQFPLGQHAPMHAQSRVTRSERRGDIWTSGAGDRR